MPCINDINDINDINEKTVVRVITLFLCHFIHHFCSDLTKTCFQFYLFHFIYFSSERVYVYLGRR